MNKNNLVVEKIMIDPKTKETKHYQATVQTEQDDTHKTFSLTYEGYRSDWVEVK